MGAKFRFSPFEIADLIALARWAPVVRISIAERGLGIATALEHSALKPFTTIKTGVTVTASPPHKLLSADTATHLAYAR
jgi:hypothetical protein